MPAPTPKQAVALLSSPGKSSIYDTTGGAVTAQFAAHNLALVPPPPPGSIIHDNACGTGTVSRLILTSTPPPANNITIHATDTDQTYLDVLSTLSAQHAWPLSISNQRMESLSFNDETFTHSFTNIGIIFAGANGLDGAKEIHRTLKPGGVAVVNCWAGVTWLMPFMMAQGATRTGARPPRPVVSWSDGEHIRKVMLEAGFANEGMRVEQSEAWAKTRDLRAWAEMAWTILGQQMGWWEGDEDKWDEAMDVFVEKLMEQEGTKKVGDEVWMKATQWVVVATK